MFGSGFGPMVLTSLEFKVIIEEYDSGKGGGGESKAEIKPEGNQMVFSVLADACLHSTVVIGTMTTLWNGCI